MCRETAAGRLQPAAMAGVRLLLMLVVAAHAGFHGAAGAAKCRAAVRSVAAAMRSSAWLLVAAVAAGVRGSSGCSESCGQCSYCSRGWVLRQRVYFL